MRPHPRVALVVAAAVWAAAGGCAGDDDDGAGAPEGPTTTGPATAGSDSDSAGGTDPPGTGSPSVTAVATIPEVGVPGLDSDDVVCRAWSRFGGSFQVVAVAASFGSGGPVAAAALEVIASPVVTTAYDDMVANLPDELEAEAEAVADGYLGPFARRAERALAELEAAGADQAAMATIVAAWETALADRDPTDPEVAVELPDDVRALVDAAAAEFEAQVVPVPSDPSLITGVEVPLTEQYLADTCPDQGTLSGVDG
ncbi:MAG: hypothetical protein ACRDZZ_04130 [Ilumatobacteraceae bacterium]